MSNFQKQFTSVFCKKLLTLLENCDQLEKARENFQEGNQNIERYLCRSSFGLHSWSPENAAMLSAAVAEALQQTTTHFFTLKEERIRLIQTYSESIKNKLIPELTKGVNGLNPLEDVKMRLQNMARDETTYMENPYVLFSGLAITGAIAATVVWSLTQASPK